VIGDPKGIGEVRSSHYCRNDIALFKAIRNAGNTKWKEKYLPDYYVIDKFPVFLQSTLQTRLQS
jgi:hypothetical protein